MTTADAETLLAEGYRARREGRSGDARVQFAEAVEQARRAGDRAPLALALAGLGQIERDLGQTGAALECYGEAVRILRTLDLPLRLAHTVRHEGDILQGAGRPGAAIPCFVEALDIFRKHPETPPLDLANTLRGFALARSAAGARKEAVLLWQEAGEIYAAAGVEAGVSESERQVAQLRAHPGKDASGLG
jgi:tetratricopeptide (TPR) repeat protein